MTHFREHLREARMSKLNHKGALKSVPKSMLGVAGLAPNLAKAVKDVRKYKGYKYPKNEGIVNNKQIELNDTLTKPTAGALGATAGGLGAGMLSAKLTSKMAKDPKKKKKAMAIRALSTLGGAAAGGYLGNLGGQKAHGKIDRKIVTAKE